MQAAATSVAFLTGSHVLASTGLDEHLLLLDRRANRVAASASPGAALHAMACRDDGSTIAVGTAGKHTHQCPFAVVSSAHYPAQAGMIVTVTNM